MKEFFRDKINITIMSLFLAALICLPLISVSVYFFLAFSLISGVGTGFLSVKVYGRYKKRVDYNPKDDTFDATEIDYDEDVYLMDTGKKTKKKLKGFGKVDSMTPFIVCVGMIVLFAGLFIWGLIKIL